MGINHLKARIARFRSREDGSVMVEAALVMSLLAASFVGLVTYSSAVDKRIAGENAVTDITLTVRTLGDLEDRSNGELQALFENIAQDSLETNQSVTISVNRSCGCPLSNQASFVSCTVGVCPDGFAPSKYLNVVLSAKPTRTSLKLQDDLETFSISTSMEYL